MSYQKAEDELNCSSDTVLNQMKIFHQRNEIHSEFTDKIDAILTKLPKMNNSWLVNKKE